MNSLDNEVEYYFLPINNKEYDRPPNRKEKSQLTSFLRVHNSQFYFCNNEISILINQMNAWLVCITRSNHITIQNMVDHQFSSNIFSWINLVLPISFFLYCPHSLKTIDSKTCQISLNLLNITTIKAKWVSMTKNNFKWLHWLYIVNCIKMFIIKFLITTTLAWTLVI